MKKFLSPNVTLVILVYGFMLLCQLIKEFGGF